MHARFITSLGYVTMMQGMLKTAVSHSQEAVAIWQQLGNKLMQANTLENLGDAYAHSDDITLARASYEDGLKLTKHHPDDLFSQQLQQDISNKIANLPDE